MLLRRGRCAVGRKCNEYAVTPNERQRVSGARWRGERSSGRGARSLQDERQEMQRLLLLGIAATERKRLWVCCVIAAEVEGTALAWPTLSSVLAAMKEGARGACARERNAKRKQAQDLPHHGCQ